MSNFQSKIMWKFFLCFYERSTKKNYLFLYLYIIDNSPLCTKVPNQTTYWQEEVTAHMVVMSSTYLTHNTLTTQQSCLHLASHWKNVFHYWLTTLRNSVSKYMLEKDSKTEILFVHAPASTYADPKTFDNCDLSNVQLGTNTFFPVVKKFCYHGSVLTHDYRDIEVD